MPVNSSKKPVSIIGGYLGSGKTTLINQLLRHCGDTRIAVLVNDFGNLAVDAELIESAEGNIISLSGGCVCCSYGNDLSMALMDVLSLNSQPDHIVIEASGVALPGAIASGISLIKDLQLHGTIVLVNAETIRVQASDRYVGDTIERQASLADILVLNKTDLLDEKEIADTKAWIADRWPAPRLVTTNYAQIPAALVLDELPDVLLNNDTESSNAAGNDVYVKNSSQHDASLYMSFTLAVNTDVDANELAQILACRDYSLARAKGFVIDKQGMCKLIQVVGRRWQISDAPPSVAPSSFGKIVCIGIAESVAIEKLKLAAKLFIQTNV